MEIKWFTTKQKQLGAVSAASYPGAEVMYSHGILNILQLTRNNILAFEKILFASFRYTAFCPDAVYFNVSLEMTNDPKYSGSKNEEEDLVSKVFNLIGIRRTINGCQVLMIGIQAEVTSCVDRVGVQKRTEKPMPPIILFDQTSHLLTRPVCQIS